MFVNLHIIYNLLLFKTNVSFHISSVERQQSRNAAASGDTEVPSSPHEPPTASNTTPQKSFSSSCSAAKCLGISWRCHNLGLALLPRYCPHSRWSCQMSLERLPPSTSQLCLQDFLMKVQPLNDPRNHCSVYRNTKLWKPGFNIFSQHAEWLRSLTCTVPFKLNAFL